MEFPAKGHRKLKNGFSGTLKKYHRRDPLQVSRQRSQSRNSLSCKYLEARKVEKRTKHLLYSSFP